MKIIIVLLFLIITFNLTAQNELISITIPNDTIVKSAKQEAVKLDIIIHKLDTLVDTISLYEFPIYVSSIWNVFGNNINEIITSNFGLIYLITQTNDSIIGGSAPILFSPENLKEDCLFKRNSYYSVVDTQSKHLKIKKEKYNPNKKKVERLPYFVTKPQQHMSLYLLIGEDYRELHKGEYFLYLYYFLELEAIRYAEKDIARKSAKGSIFYGKIISNKVRLIIK